MEITVCNIYIYIYITCFQEHCNLKTSMKYVHHLFSHPKQTLFDEEGRGIYIHIYIYIYICIPDIFFNLQCFLNRIYTLYMKPRRTKKKWNWLCVVYTLHSAKPLKSYSFVKTIIFILGLVMSASRINFGSAPTMNTPHPVVTGYEAANAPLTNICTGLQSSFILVEQVCKYHVCVPFALPFLSHIVTQWSLFTQFFSACNWKQTSQSSAWKPRTCFFT